MLNKSAIRTRSAKDFAAIFRMTLPRCTFTVILVTPISAATCLFNKPPVTPGHDLLFARRQSRKLSLQIGNRAVLFVFHPSAFKRDLDGVQQILIAKWFGQKLDSSSLHCPHCHGYIAMAGDENNWDFSI